MILGKIKTYKIIQQAYKMGKKKTKNPGARIVLKEHIEGKKYGIIWKFGKTNLFNKLGEVFFSKDIYIFLYM